MAGIVRCGEVVDLLECREDSVWRYQLSHEDSRVKRIAGLAGLNLTDCEIHQFEDDLTDMVAFVERVNRIVLSDGNDGPVLSAPLRPDEKRLDANSGDLFGPERTDEEGFLVVPPVLGEDT